MCAHAHRDHTLHAWGFGAGRPLHCHSRDPELARSRKKDGVTCSLTSLPPSHPNDVIMDHGGTRIPHRGHIALLFGSQIDAAASATCTLSSMAVSGKKKGGSERQSVWLLLGASGRRGKQERHIAYHTRAPECRELRGDMSGLYL